MALHAIGTLVLAVLVISPDESRVNESDDVRGILREALEAGKASQHFPFSLDGIPSAMARAGDVEGALGAAKLMKRDATELERIAIVRAKAGDLSGALQTANAIAEDTGKARALAQIAGVQADQGKVSAAQETAAKITSPGDKAWALALIASAQAKAGQIEAALKTAKSMTDDSNFAYLKAGPLSDIALAQAKAGRLDDALATATLVQPEYFRADVLAHIAEQIAKAGDAAGAKRFLKQAEELLSTARADRGVGFALQRIAVVQMKLGDRDTARKTFRQALQAIDDKNKRLVVEAWARAGDVPEAIQAATRLGLAQGLEYIAVVQAEAGDFNGALATAESIANLEIRSSALAQVAATQRTAGRLRESKTTFEKAVETAHSIVRRGVDDPIARVVYSIAYYQAKSGDWRSALTWARKEQGADARSRALLGTAVGILDGKEAEPRLRD